MAIEYSEQEAITNDEDVLQVSDEFKTNNKLHVNVSYQFVGTRLRSLAKNYGSNIQNSYLFELLKDFNSDRDFIKDYLVNVFPYSPEGLGFENLVQKWAKGKSRQQILLDKDLFESTAKQLEAQTKEEIKEALYAGLIPLNPSADEASTLRVKSKKGLSLQRFTASGQFINSLVLKIILK